MQPRPRNAENRVAELLSEFFRSIGHKEVERVPVIGRTGPDISINDFGLVVDVKSRLIVPEAFFYPRNKDMYYDTMNGMVTVRLNRLHLFSDAGNKGHLLIYPSVRVRKWLDHMDEWRRENHPRGISMIVLHKPRLPFGDAVAVIYQSDLRRFHDRINRSLSGLHQHGALPALAAAG